MARKRYGNNRFATLKLNEAKTKLATVQREFITKKNDLSDYGQKVRGSK